MIIRAAIILSACNVLGTTLSALHIYFKLSQQKCRLGYIIPIYHSGSCNQERIINYSLSPKLAGDRAGIPTKSAWLQRYLIVNKNVYFLKKSSNEVRYTRDTMTVILREKYCSLCVSVAKTNVVKDSLCFICGWYSRDNHILRSN